MRLRKFRFDRPQQIAALLLLLLLGQCLWVISHRTLSDLDYQFARCGREMWERPSPLAGYFTTCGNIHDGTLAYRATGLPLTIERIFAGQAASTSTWEMRHEVSYTNLLLRLPFVLAGLSLGAALWWVTRRLYGNEGGFVALALYCCSPEIIRACTYPNNEILAAFGLFAAIYTAVGVSHAMQGPPRKWRPRIVLLAACFGFTAAAHVSAVLLAFLLGIPLMLYLAERRRASVIPIVIITALATLFLLFASYAFNLDAFSYVFRSSAARVWFSLEPVARFFSAWANAGIALAAAVALLLYTGIGRCRYFGNTVPLAVGLLLFLLTTTGTPSQPWLWALPFLLTFVGGVFADALESRQRRLFLFLGGGLLLAQMALSVVSLPLLGK